MKKDKLGEVPIGRIPIYTHKGHIVGNVGPRATHATVARFLGHHGAKLGKKNGRQAWIEPPPPPKSRSKPRPAMQSGGSYMLEASLRAAKGSNSTPPGNSKTRR